MMYTEYSRAIQLSHMYLGNSITIMIQWLQNSTYFQQFALVYACGLQKRQ